jgi:hypothetical protein
MPGTDFIWIAVFGPVLRLSRYVDWRLMGGTAIKSDDELAPPASRIALHNLPDGAGGVDDG